MITALAPLGAKYSLTFAPEYSADGSVSVAVTYKHKGDKDAAPKVLSFSGTAEEVELALTTDLPKAVEKLVTHATTLEDLDKELAAAEKEKKDKVAKKTTAPAPKATPAAKKATPAKKAAPAKPAAKPTASAKAAAKSEAMKRAAATRAANKAKTAPAASTKTATPSAALKPAWTGKKNTAAPSTTTVDKVGAPAPAASAPAAEDLGALFQ